MSFIEILPSETWTHVASFLRNDDLTRLSRTCRFLLTISRTLLYQDVTLDSYKSNPNILETLKLLSSEPELARYIRNICIVHRAPEERDPEGVQLMVDALANATSLNTLFVGSCFFQFEHQQEKFVNYMRNRSPPLRDLFYWGQPLPSDSFCIPHLKSIGWYSNTGPALWSLLLASRETIEELKFNLMFLLPEIDTAPLWEIHFPNLLSIEIGNAHDHDIFERNSANTFFQVHALDYKLTCIGLEHFVYGACSFVLYDGSSSSSFEPLNDRRLRVRTLKGPPAFIADMAKHRMLYVKDVLKIDVLHPPHTTNLLDTLLEFNHMFERLLSENIRRPVFPDLHTIICTVLEPFSQKWESQTALKEICLRVLECAAELWADHLTCWLTVFPPFDISAEELGDAFGKFRKLNDVYLPLQTMGGLEKMEAYAHSLARKCPHLIEVHVADKDFYPDAYHLLVITRKEDNMFVDNQGIECAYFRMFL